MAIWLVQGVFFQKQGRLDTRYIDLELRAVVVRQLVGGMYAGVFAADPNDPEKMIGHMFDQYGDSVLSDIVLKDDKFSFLKQYERRRDKIRYTFTRENGGRVWCGDWSMEQDGHELDHGQSNCAITVVGEQFFQPTALPARVAEA